MLSQLVQFAHLYEVILSDVDVDVRATFDSADKFDLPGPSNAFQQVTYQVTVRSPSPEEQVRKLAAHAERACHAARSLEAAVPTTTELTLKPPR